jgi:PHP family Zn ribbon phosphoesterase
MHTFRAELHVHTVLSPCAEIEMIPPLIVTEALERGLNLIAITDHNASANVAAVQRAAQGRGLHVLPGMEVQTREEVHVLCLFDSLDQLNAWQGRIDQALPNLDNNAEHLGEQFIVDETGEFLRREPRLLLTSTSLSIEAVFAGVNQLGGLAVPAHVDRTAFGLFPVLGFIPAGLQVEALEVSARGYKTHLSLGYPQLAEYPVLVGGDAHVLDQILGVNRFELAAPTIPELRLALAGRSGRAFDHVSLDT